MPGPPAVEVPLLLIFCKDEYKSSFDMFPGIKALDIQTRQDAVVCVCVYVYVHVRARAHTMFLTPTRTHHRSGWNDCFQFVES